MSNDNYLNKTYKLILISKFKRGCRSGQTGVIKAHVA